MGNGRGLRICVVMTLRLGIEIMSNFQQGISNFQVVVAPEIPVKSMRELYLDIGHFLLDIGYF